LKNIDNIPSGERHIILEKIGRFLAVGAVSSEPVSPPDIKIQGIYREFSTLSAAQSKFYP
jgi:hypothetical protein